MPVCACPIWHMQQDYFPCQVTFYSHMPRLVRAHFPQRNIYVLHLYESNIKIAQYTLLFIRAVVDGFGIDGSAIGGGGGFGAQTLTSTSSQGRNTAMLSRARAVHEQERNERGHRLRLSSGGVMCWKYELSYMLIRKLLYSLCRQ